MDAKLQKLISQAGLTSRRKAEQWISEGRVAVNGTPASLGDRADLTVDKVTVDGKPLRAPGKMVVALLNKPRGYVSTLSDPQNRPTVAQLLDSIPLRLFPVGRLDYSSEGLLLLTNDGELAHRLMHPRHHVEKCYLVRVRGHLSSKNRKRLEQGVLLDDGMTAPARISNLRNVGSNCWFEIVLREGRNRQVRRMCEAIGHTVLRLKRIRIDSLQLGDLKPGQHRLLSEPEIDCLKNA